MCSDTEPATRADTGLATAPGAGPAPVAPGRPEQRSGGRTDAEQRTGARRGRPRPLRHAAVRPATRRSLAAVLGEVRWEVLPLDDLGTHTAHLPPGARVTVTCSPKRGVDETVETAVRLAGRGFEAVPHLAARQVAGPAHLAELTGRLAAAGVDDVFVVGGDAAEPAGPYDSGLALLEAMAAHAPRFTRVGVPAYPEGHPRIDDEILWAALEAKQRHATYVVTQMCFDAGAICGWVAAARRRGVVLPVYAGVPGVVEPVKLLRISARIGVGDSLRFLRGNHRAVARLLRPGGYRPDAVLRELGERVRAGRCEVAGLHVYTFNRVEPTVSHYEALRRRAFDEQEEDAA